MFNISRGRKGFDQTVRAVAWPVSLLQLVLGNSFDQDVGAIARPSALQQLTFG